MTSELSSAPLGEFPPPSDELKKILSAGGSGVVVNKTMKYPNMTLAFSGQGHTLSASKPESEDNKLATMETDSTDSEASSDSKVFSRVGPGYTVLNPQATNEVNVTSEAFRHIVSGIEAVLENVEDDEMEPVDMSKVC